jgi:hypothetical protein
LVDKARNVGIKITIDRSVELSRWYLFWRCDVRACFTGLIVCFVSHGQNVRFRPEVCKNNIGLAG